ncbi:MAG: flavodoxin family protein [Gammaproteobacteria bacterium]|nr:flavodoxin family protein [Gammaproteobacteria bacterium]
MANLLIVYHAPSPNMQRLADAVIDGAQSPEIDHVTVRAGHALASGPDDLLWCDGVIFGTTENFGYMSGALKDFFERSYYPCLDKVNARPYALFVKAGNDGTGTLSSVQRIVTGLELKPVAEPLLMVGRFQESWLDDCRELGMTLAAGLEAGIF